MDRHNTNQTKKSIQTTDTRTPGNPLDQCLQKLSLSTSYNDALSLAEEEGVCFRDRYPLFLVSLLYKSQTFGPQLLYSRGPASVFPSFNYHKPIGLISRIPIFTFSTLVSTSPSVETPCLKVTVSLSSLDQSPPCLSFRSRYLNPCIFTRVLLNLLVPSSL